MLRCLSIHRWFTNAICSEARNSGWSTHWQATLGPCFPPTVNLCLCHVDNLSLLSRYSQVSDYPSYVSHDYSSGPTQTTTVQTASQSSVPTYAIAVIVVVFGLIMAKLLM